MGDAYMLNGKILSGLPNHAKDIEFDNTGTTLSSANAEDAIKEVNSNLSNNYDELYSGSTIIPVGGNVNLAHPWTDYKYLIFEYRYTDTGLNYTTVVFTQPKTALSNIVLVATAYGSTVHSNFNSTSNSQLSCSIQGTVSGVYLIKIYGIKI